MSSGNATGTVTITGIPLEGQVLEAQAVGIADPDGIGTILYGWARFDGVNTITVSLASPDPHYTVTGDDVGSILIAGVVFIDGTGSQETIISDPTAVVTSNNIEPTGAPIITGTLLVGETLTADASSIADADGLGPFSYSWVRVKDDQSTVLSSGDTYTLTADDAHAHLKVVVTYLDGGSFTENVESALSASVASEPGDVPPRIEFRFGDNKVNENEVGASVGTLLFDGINNPAVTYTIVADPTGRFEMNGFELKLTPSTAFDFEAAATQQVQIRVTDGVSLDYTETVTVEVVDRPSTPGLGTHPPITDPVVAADVLALVFPSYGSDPLATPQWLNEGSIEFSFPTQGGVFVREGFSEFARQFSATEQDMARSILASISGLVPTRFVEVSQAFTSATATTIEMAIGNFASGIFGVAALLPGSALLIDTNVSRPFSVVKLGDGFHSTLIHEIGHALGLDHGQNIGASDTPPHLPVEHDRSAYSAMNQHYPDGFVQTYMMSDIATLQYLYGANFGTNAGDTTYTWSETTGETFVNGVSMGTPAFNYILMTVWDGGGNDTYDASNYAGGVEIDLRPGEFSTLSAAQFGAPTAIGNVGNAYLYYGDLRSLIENAIGGDGEDTLVGNQGANRLKGNGGADDLDGGDGNDTAVFDSWRINYRVEDLGSGEFRITDLRAGPSDGIDTTHHIEYFEFLDGTFSAATVLNPPITGSPSNDAFTAPAGNSRFDAGVGLDTLTFNFRLVDATFTWSGNTVTVDTATSHTVISGFEKFVFTDGTVNNIDENPLVDDLFYYARNHDVWEAHFEADAHYEQYGWHERRDPDAFFSTKNYLAINADVRALGINPLTHFDQVGWLQGRVPSLDFDVAKYLAVNTDVAAAHIDPLAHFLFYGHEENRVPFAVDRLIGAHGFDYAYYLRQNPDVAANGIDPLLHYGIYGWKEGRNPNALFDTNGYLAAYGDVRAANINPLSHYDEYGWRETRDPSGAFDTIAYLTQNPDVLAAQMNPLTHFLQYGITEGRTALNDGLFHV